MLRYTIVHERRRPVNKSSTWAVKGACEPPAFDSLADARLFVNRETQKYVNGSITPFVPTHMILWQPPQSPAVKRRIPVRMVISTERASDLIALYKEEDWEPCTFPEWQYDPSIGRLLLEEILMGFSWRLLNYEDALANFAVLTISDTPDQVRFRAF